MAIKLKLSTAGQVIPIGPFISSTDLTDQTPTIANTDIKLHKRGATTLANKNSGGATSISNGVFHTTLDATDTNTLGSLIIFCRPTGCMPVRVECEVLGANRFESEVTGTEWLDVCAFKPDWSIAGSTLTVKKTDDATTQFTKDLTDTPGANPITGMS